MDRACRRGHVYYRRDSQFASLCNWNLFRRRSRGILRRKEDASGLGSRAAKGAFRRTGFRVCVATGLDGKGILRAGGCAMPNFYEYNPEQGYLLPPSVREVLGEKHLCFFIHQAVERLDWKQFEQGYSDEGHPAYHPVLLLKVWLYAYALGVSSSRRLEQRLREDLAFRYLAAGAQPDYWALNEFRKRHGRAINDVF